MLDKLTASGGGNGDAVEDVTTANFASKVLDHSHRQPVLVDFWAPWCGPCRQLAPVLEKAVAEAGGSVKLVKMNIDDEPQIAGQLGIQSIPAVVAFVDGKPADAFMGAQPQGEIRAFIEKIAGPAVSPLDDLLAEALTAIDVGDFERAETIYLALRDEAPEELKVIGAYGELLVDNGRLDDADQLALAIGNDQRGDEALATFLASLDLAQQAAGLGELGDLVAAVERDPSDNQSRFDLAAGLNSAGKRTEAAEQLLEIIAHQQQWQDEAARKQLLQFFEAWGASDPATGAARRKLSALLFS